MVKEIKGDLIKLALQGKFDAIAHGCNCFCNMGAGIAPQMAKAFGADTFPLEHRNHVADKNKLGTIDCQLFIVENGVATPYDYNPTPPNGLYVINAYTQYGFGKNHKYGKEKPIDYEALTLCMRKINHLFNGSHVGLPLIGAGLAGGDWNIIKEIIIKELKDCKVTIVHYEPEK